MNRATLFLRTTRNNPEGLISVSGRVPCVLRQSCRTVQIVFNRSLADHGSFSKVVRNPLGYYLASPWATTVLIERQRHHGISVRGASLKSLYICRENEF